jgi:hypothetical protein
MSNQKERRLTRQPRSSSVPEGHVRTPWADLYVPSVEILQEIDSSFEEGLGYIHEFPKLHAKRAKVQYYTDKVLTDADVPVSILGSDGTLYLGVIRYVANEASLGQIRRNIREFRARKKAQSASSGS